MERTTVEEIIKQWRAEFKLRADQIAILSSKRREKSSFANLSRLSGLPITNEPAAWRNGSGILFTTIAAFKGLESDAIVLLHDSTLTSRFDSYVATSRAKHLLAIVELANVDATADG